VAISGKSGEKISLGSTYSNSMGAALSMNKLIPPVLVVSGVFIGAYVVTNYIRGL
jgi:hypothetical protein